MNDEGVVKSTVGRLHRLLKRKIGGGGVAGDICGSRTIDSDGAAPVAAGPTQERAVHDAVTGGIDLGHERVGTSAVGGLRRIDDGEICRTRDSADVSGTGAVDGNAGA